MYRLNKPLPPKGQKIFKVFLLSMAIIGALLIVISLITTLGITTEFIPSNGTTLMLQKLVGVGAVLFVGSFILSFGGE